MMYTDYPITELGDIEGGQAPIRPCTIVDYDTDKYVTIVVGGFEKSIKRWYVYNVPGRCGDVRQVSRFKLMKIRNAKRKKERLSGK